MNQIYIGEASTINKQEGIFYVQFEQADKYLQILRADYFSKVYIDLPENLNDKQLKFMMHLSRIIKINGQIHLKNNQESFEFKKFTNLAHKLGLYLHQDSQNTHYFSKQKIEQSKIQKVNDKGKMSIGFKSNQEQEIDEDQLMKNQNIKIQKSKIQNCAQKPKACANCNCGRKNNDQPLISKQQLIETINQGKPVSGCGKCFLGDSFRCGSCPYKGLPAFKPGDKLKLVDQGQVVVQTGEVKVSSGKVKIQL